MQVLIERKKPFVVGGCQGGLAPYDRSVVSMIESASGDGWIHEPLDRPVVAVNESEDRFKFVEILDRRGISIAVK